MAVNPLNPNFLRDQVNDSGFALPKRDRIYSTLEDLYVASLSRSDVTGILYERIATGNNLSIQALNVTLTGEIAIPLGDLKIFCRTLTISSPLKGHEHEPGASLDVSAKPLEAPYDKPLLPKADTAEDGKNGASGNDLLPADKLLFGKPGAAAGSIEIVCDTLQLGGRLALNARGGRGYPGGNGQHGGAPRGGIGKGGRGGDAGAGGGGGAGGRITICCRKVVGGDGKTTAGWDLIDYDASGGKPGTPGSAGHGGGGGSGRGSPASPGEEGKEGTVVLDDGIAPELLGQTWDDIFLLKLLKKAQLLYLANQPARFKADSKTRFPPEWEKLGQLLAFLNGVMASYAGASAEDAQSDLAAAERKRRIATAVGTLFGYFNHPGGALTYFGWSPNWVPSQPLPEMVALYNTNFKAWTGIETAYTTLADTYNKNKDKQEALNTATRALDEQTQTAQAIYESALSEFENMHGLLKDADNHLVQARAALQEPVEALTKEIKDYQDCKPDHIFAAAGQIVFTASHPTTLMAMAGVQVASLINESMTKITNKDGKSFDKTYLVDEIKYIGELSGAEWPRSVRDNLIGADGKIDPKAKLLVTTLTSFRAEIDSLAGKLDRTKVGNLDSAIETFVATLDAKGSLQLAFNQAAVQLVGLYDKWQEAKSGLGKLERRQDAVSVYDANLVGYFGALYQDQLDRIARAVAMIQRKQAYLTLDNASDLSVASSLNGIWAGGEAPSEDRMSSFDLKVKEVINAVSDYRSGQASAARPNPADKKLRGNIHADVTDPALLAAFKAGQPLTITTVADPTKHDAGKGYLYVNDSGTEYDCRVTHVCPRVFGAKHARQEDGNVLLRVRAGLTGSIEDADGNMLTYSSTKARFCEFEHRTNTTAADETNTDSGQGKDGSLNDQDLDAIGLYGRWTVDIPKPRQAGDTNFGLDLSGVTCVRLYFRIISRTKASALA